MKRIAVKSKPIAMPLVCLQKWPAGLKYKEDMTWWKISRLSSSKCRSVRFRASLISTMVKNDPILKLTLMSSGPVWRELNVGYQQTKSAEFFVWYESWLVLPVVWSCGDHSEPQRNTLLVDLQEPVKSQKSCRQPCWQALENEGFLRRRRVFCSTYSFGSFFSLL